MIANVNDNVFENVKCFDDDDDSCSYVPELPSHNDSSKNTRCGNCPEKNKNETCDIKCLTANVDSLPNKLEELRNLIIEKPVDIIALSEVNLKGKDSDDFVLEGYSCMTDHTGRGVSLFIKEGFDIVRLSDLEQHFKPSIITKIKPQGGGKMFIFCVVYRSPSASNDENEKLNFLLQELYRNNSNNVIVTGDFNYPEVNWLQDICPTKETHCAYKFHEILQENYVQQLIKEPTHHRGDQKPNVLDLILVNQDNLVKEVELSSPIGKSHHSTIHFEITGMRANFQKQYTDKRQVSKGDYEGMRKFVNDYDWSNILDKEKSVDDCWTEIKGVIKSAIDKFIPLKKVSSYCKPRKDPIPESLLEKVRLKRRLYKYYKKYPTKQNWNSYARVRNQVNWLTKKNEKQKEINLAKQAKNNLKPFFTYVSRKTKVKEGVANLEKPDGNLTETDSEKAEVLNNFFTSVFTIETDTNIPTFSNNKDVSIDSVSVSTEQFKKALLSLNISKSPGPDEIHPRVLRELANELCYPLKYLFDKTIVAGKIPKEWKIAEVRPIFKKGDKNTPGNYRPVSLTPIICKLFEGFIRDKLSDHLLSNDLLYKDQYGFTKGRSTVTQLLTTVHDWMGEIDQGNPVDAVYLDLRKAFDTVPHLRLINKLKGYGINGGILSWITDFLSDRTQFVTVNSSSSPKVPVTSGVPQGSVLGPILFIYYINDMPDFIDCPMKIFADDTKAYSCVPTPEMRDKLQRCINSLNDWTETWLLQFNTSKCKVLHIGKNNPNYDYYMKSENGINKLEATFAEKDLGVIIDPNLSFDAHITATVKKANRLAGLLMRNIAYKHKDIIIPLYKALIRSILEYGNPVWNPYLRKHVNLIEGVQRRITRCVIGTRGMTYEQRLEYLKIPSLEYRRIRGCLIEVYKILHNLYDPKTTSTLFQLSHGSTRGHDLKLTKHATKTNMFKYFFTNRMINTWNNLTRETVNAPSVNAFKNRLDRELVDYMSSVDLSYLAGS